MNRNERRLKIFLRILGIFSILALVPTLMPVAWMASIHEGLKLGPFPQGPAVEYMARSLSAFYAMFGGLLLVVSGDVRRHSRVIAYVGIVEVLFGLLILIVELRIGVPLHLVLSEGPVIILFGLIILFFLARTKRETRATEPPS